MQLREFTLISPSLQAGHVFKAIETAIPATVVDQVIADTASRAKR